MTDPTPPACDPARIRERRRELGMSQVELADAAGINQGYLSLIENGLRTPSAGTLAWLAKALRCEVTDLTAEDGPIPTGLDGLPAPAAWGARDQYSPLMETR